MSARKKKVDPIVLQMASDLAQIEARLESITQGAVAQQGHLEQRMRGLEALFSNRAGDRAGDVCNITVGDGGSIRFETRS